LLRKLAFFAGLVLSTVAPAQAIEFAGREVVLPVVARGPGAAGSIWQTDIVITNVSTRQEQIDVAMSFRQGSSSSHLFTGQLAPRESLVFRDVLAETFGLESAHGYARIWTNFPNARLVAYARIYNVGSSAGEYGQNAVALEWSKMSRKSYLTGLSGVGGNRTNIGITNPSSVDVDAFVSIFERSGEMRAGIATTVAGESVLQINDAFAYFGLAPFDGATVQITTSKDVYAWASVARSDSGDASFITATGVESVDGVTIVPPACESAAPLWLSPRPGQGWIVVFEPGIDVAARTAALAALHGFTPQYLYAGFPGFVAALSQQTIATLRCEPDVIAVEQNTSPMYP
jgi:hypothetical protein